MTKGKPAGGSNFLLSALPKKDFRRFIGSCDYMQLVFSEVLAEPGERIRHVYFPLESFISLTMQISHSNDLEVGLIGNEGMLGVSLVLGVGFSPLHAMVQGKGAVLRMGVPAFRRELVSSPSLQRVLKLYLYVLMLQLAQTAACNRFHVVEVRLARWLLMTQDRAHSDTFHVTQEFLSFMLGVRRVGVTKAAISLQNRKLISYSRGNIKIIDRQGLEVASCICYEAGNATYAQIMK